MAAPLSLTAIYEPVDNGWTPARVKELPGVITAAPTPDEAREMLEDALREYLVAQLETGGEPGSPTARGALVLVTVQLLAPEASGS